MITGEGSLSPGKQWYVSSIQNGLYVWELNYDKFNTDDGSDEGVLGIRKVGAQDLGVIPKSTWIWRGSTWTSETSIYEGCTDPSALKLSIASCCR